MLSYRVCCMCFAVTSTLFCGGACTSDDEFSDASADGDSNAPEPPEAMWGEFGVDLDGDWVGVCTLTISRNALLQDLHVERDGWTAHHRGRYYSDSVAVVGTVWIFSFGIDVDTPSGPEEQRWDFEIPEEGVTADGFVGTYSHRSVLTGTSTGTTSGERR